MPMQAWCARPGGSRAEFRKDSRHARACRRVIAGIWRPDATNLRTKRLAGSACSRANMHGPFLFEKSLLIPPSHRIMSDVRLGRPAAGSRGQAHVGQEEENECWSSFR